MHQFIDGRRVGARASGHPFAVVDPATGETVESVELAGPDDVDDAVAAARRAYPSWTGATPAERSAALVRLAALLGERAGELATTETRQTGKPIKLSSEFDVPGTIDNVAFFAGAARNLEGKAAGEYSPDHTSLIRRESIGVVGSVSPWNYPLQMAAWKILPAIAAGNTIVLKPAEITPLTSLLFADACAEAGIPPGSSTWSPGRARSSARHSIGHPDVDMVSFTGSTAVGQRVMRLAADGVKRVHLELGGKAPFVVFDDADLDAAVHGAVAGALINTGQDCTAATRAYVQRPLYDAFVAGVADLMTQVRMGDPMDPSTDQGPLVSRRQQERVAGFVERARADGGKVVVGGEMPGGSLARGAYYQPTLVVDADQRSEVVQQEIFGPVLVVLPFDSDDDGLSLANDSPYGLAASAWTTQRLPRPACHARDQGRLRVGQRPHPDPQ